MTLDFSQLKNKTIAVAVSGGMDSCVLLHRLYCEREKFNLNLKVVNVEHGIRGASSESDSLFVKKLCEKYNLELLFYKVDVPLFAKQNKIGTELAARKLRYNCFEEVIKNSKADFIATAHHMSDNAESILFNLLRGTGLKGAVGIAFKKDYIVRPLLYTARKDIELYAKHNGLEYVTDESNFDDSYTRNFLRLNIFPELKKVFPECERALINFSQAAQQDNDLLQEMAKKLLVFKENEAKIEFCKQKPLFMRAVIYALKYLNQPLDYTSKQLLAVYELQKKQNGAKASLNGGVCAVRDYQGITLYKEETLFETKFEVPFSTSKTALGQDRIAVCTKLNLTAAEFIKSVKALPFQPEKNLVFDLQKIPENAVFRTRRTGDVFCAFQGRTKSLKKYLIEKNIPERRRDSLILLADGKNILAVLGVQISELIKVDNNSKVLYNITVTKGEEDA